MGWFNHQPDIMANPVKMRCFSWSLRHGEPPHLRSNVGGHGGGFQPDGLWARSSGTYSLSLSLVVVDDDNMNYFFMMIFDADDDDDGGYYYYYYFHYYYYLLLLQSWWRMITDDWWLSLLDHLRYLCRRREANPKKTIDNSTSNHSVPISICLYTNIYTSRYQYTKTP